MSDLARRKDARELWVSRSHLHAAAAMALLGGLICFGAGYALGRSGMSAAEPVRHATLTGDVPGRELVELLAEVERAAMVHPSSAMQYPNWAESEDGLELPDDVPPSAGVTAAVPAPPRTDTPQTDTLPDAAWTISVGTFETKDEAWGVREHLRAKALDAWVTVRLEDGKTLWWVGVEGFEEPLAAEERLALTVEAMKDAPSSQGEPGLQDMSAL